MTEQILKIEISDDHLYSDEYREEIQKLYIMIIDRAKDLGIWDKSIKTVLITDNFDSKIREQCEKWDLRTDISLEKEYSVVSKYIFNYNLEQPEYIIFINFNSFISDSYPHWEIALGQILTIWANKIIPVTVKEKYYFQNPKSLQEFIDVAAIEWCKAYYSGRFLNKIFEKQEIEFDQNAFLIAFKRKLKKSLFEYNSYQRNDKANLPEFWISYFDNLKTLFLRLSERTPQQTSNRLNEKDPAFELIKNVLTEIKLLTADLLEEKEFDTTELKKSIIEFSAHYDIILKDETNNNFRIKLTKNPKDYFVDEIVETEPRIVCFMDILGFSELINQYEKDLTSTVLQDIQESFRLAKKNLLEQNIGKNQDAIKHLRYQTFSDNICISIPYLNNQEDFIVNFNLLSIYIRGFQGIMMSKGIFMRGGISYGSYYADDNIIFSKGLVNAYFLESKKAIYPRVIIDKNIISRLLNYDFKRIEYYGIDQVIIFDWENNAFLNPFRILNTTINQVKSLFKEIEEDQEDTDDDPLYNSIMNITRNFSDLTLNLLQTASTAEEENLEPIKKSILNNILKYQDNESVFSKYLWLFNFIKWLENEDDAKLKFDYMADYVRKKKENEPGG